jgi:uncharacterized protein (TIGR03435 family)
VTSSRIVATSLVCVLLAPLGAQSPSFDAASVKKNAGGAPGASIRVMPNGDMVATNVPLRVLVRDALAVQDHQLVDLPGWADGERFDITARAPGGATPQQWQPMLQALLRERFALATRRETRELPTYVVAPPRDGRPGPRLRATPPATAEYCAAQQLPEGKRPPVDAAIGNCGVGQSIGTVRGRDIPLTMLWRFVSQQAGRAIVDRSGLTGNYDFDLTWTPEMFANRATPAVVNGNTIDPNGPSLFTALQEQLGLKLDPQRGPVDVLVIERLTRPSEN